MSLIAAVLLVIGAASGVVVTLGTQKFLQVRKEVNKFKNLM